MVKAKNGVRACLRVSVGVVSRARCDEEAKETCLKKTTPFARARPLSFYNFNVKRLLTMRNETFSYV